jgi:hypothetical protein
MIDIDKQVWGILWDNGPVSETELQTWTLLDYDTIHNSLNRLSDKDLLIIDPYSWPMSGGMVKLTTKGSKLYDRA